MFYRINSINLVDRGRIELPTEACKATVIPFNYQPMFGVPPGTRTPTNGFGDRYAAITLGILIWWPVRVTILGLLIVNQVLYL